MRHIPWIVLAIVILSALTTDSQEMATVCESRATLSEFAPRTLSSPFGGVRVLRLLCKDFRKKWDCNRPS